MPGNIKAGRKGRIHKLGVAAGGIHELQQSNANRLTTAAEELDSLWGLIESMETRLKTLLGRNTSEEIPQMDHGREPVGAVTNADRVLDITGASSLLSGKSSPCVGSSISVFTIGLSCTMNEGSTFSSPYQSQANIAAASGPFPGHSDSSAGRSVACAPLQSAGEDSESSKSLELRALVPVLRSQCEHEVGERGRSRSRQTSLLACSPSTVCAPPSFAEICSKSSNRCSSAESTLIKQEIGKSKSRSTPSRLPVCVGSKVPLDSALEAPLRTLTPALPQSSQEDDVSIGSMPNFKLTNCASAPSVCIQNPQVDVEVGEPGMCGAQNLPSRLPACVGRKIPLDIAAVSHGTLASVHDDIAKIVLRPSAKLSRCASAPSVSPKSSQCELEAGERSRLGTRSVPSRLPACVPLGERTPLLHGTEHKNGRCSTSLQHSEQTTSIPSETMAQALPGSARDENEQSGFTTFRKLSKAASVPQVSHQLELLSIPSAASSQVNLSVASTLESDGSESYKGKDKLLQLSNQRSRSVTPCTPKIGVQSDTLPASTSVSTHPPISLQESREHRGLSRNASNSISINTQFDSDCDGTRPKSRSIETRLPFAISSISFRAPNHCRCVFWTGGYDSTWRILQALLVECLTVVPIYLTGVIDNYSKMQHNRRSKKFELIAMQTIREAISECFPSAGTRLKELVLVPEVTLSRDVTKNMSTLKAKNIVRRRRCQIGAMAQLSCSMTASVDVGIVKDEFLHQKLGAYLEHRDGEYLISVRAIEEMPELGIFKWLRFPLLDYSKEDILKEATWRGFERIMQMTWTCWFPRRNGEPCGKCAMCKHRVLW